jgi:hypothetical protein
MNCNLTKRFLIRLAIGFFIVSVIFTVGCAPKKVVVVYDEDGHSGHPEVGHTHKNGGPPPHAPAHGYRAKYHYRYYPECSVYYDSGREVYFYIKGDHWEVGASLPRHLRIGLGDSVSIELETDKPYLHHAEHIKKYPPGQLKNKNMKHKWG